MRRIKVMRNEMLRKARSTPMHIPLVIAVLAFLALMLLPMLDRVPRSESDAKGPRATLTRIARWTRQ